MPDVFKANKVLRMLRIPKLLKLKKTLKVIAMDKKKSKKEAEGRYQFSKADVFRSEYNGFNSFLVKIVESTPENCIQYLESNAK